VALVLLAVVLLGGAAISWSRGVAEREAVEGALDDVPGLQPDSAEVAETTVAPPADAQPAEVVRVIDGDTLIVTGEPGTVLAAAGETTIRLLQIDTPEVDGPNTTEQCFGPQASAYTTQLLPGGSMLLLGRDEGLTDQFGRTLAFAWTADGRFVNELILRNGYGYASFVSPNDQHISVMFTAEDAARSDRRGLWGTCA